MRLGCIIAKRSLGLLTFCCRTGSVIEPNHYQVCLKAFFFVFGETGMGVGVEVAVVRASGEHQRNGVKVETSNSLNLVTKCWLKRLDLLPCAQALLLPVRTLSQGKSSHSEIPPPTSRSEASLRRLRLDEEAYKWIVSSCKYLQERAPKSGGDYELTMFHQDERKMK